MAKDVVVIYKNIFNNFDFEKFETLFLYSKNQYLTEVVLNVKEAL